jgi:hypothetical protein
LAHLERRLVNDDGYRDAAGDAGLLELSGGAGRPRLPRRARSSRRTPGVADDLVVGGSEEPAAASTTEVDVSLAKVVAPF